MVLFLIYTLKIFFTRFLSLVKVLIITLFITWLDSAILPMWFLISSFSYMITPRPMTFYSLSISFSIGLLSVDSIALLVVSLLIFSKLFLLNSIILLVYHLYKVYLHFSLPFSGHIILLMLVPCVMCRTGDNTFFFFFFLLY